MQNRLRSWFYLVLLILVIAVFVWLVYYFWPASHIDQKTYSTWQISFLDVGQGDSIYFRTPDGVEILVDGGKGNAVLKSLEAVQAEDNKIEFIFGTHPDADHVEGLIYVLDKYSVGQIFLPVTDDDDKIYKNLIERARQNNVPIKIVGRGDKIIFPGNATTTIDILWPDKNQIFSQDNQYSIVTEFSFGNKKLLLTGDADTQIEKLLIQYEGSALDSDILKLGHHGSKTSSDAVFLEKVSPEYAIVSAGKNNSYGHPHKEALESAEKVSAKVLCTCDLGNINFSSDGNNLILQNESTSQPTHSDFIKILFSKLQAL